ncbi:hypothetical protein SCUCBS95973_003331 [Sporothrix curviconia]|uniref:Uncharacterized protein n=1 Tax=Sporothrix curviconia TaxID=1260050 RepID=A0ABP0BFL7_9PEZI
MGQNFCKPCGTAQCRRLAKIKAEAAAAADATAHPANLPQPDPTVAQLLMGRNASLERDVFPATTTATVAYTPGIAISGISMPATAVLTSPASLVVACGPPQPDGPADVRIAGEQDNRGEEDDVQSPPALPQRRLRKGSREWLRRQRMRLTAARKLGRRHRHGKQKVAIAQDEAPVSSRHPIITIMASSDDGEQDGSGNDHGPPLLLVGGEQGRLTESPELIRGTNSQPSRRPAPQLLAPTPRRPMATRFPFLNQATNSADTARSSNESHHPSLTPSTVIATRRAPVVGDVGEQEVPREVNRNSLRSSSPSIYYLAPTSPEVPAPLDNRASVDGRLASSPGPPAAVEEPADKSTEEPPFLSTALSYVTSPWQRLWSITPA